ncbi:MAG TPA: hypothetical protein VFQ13_20845 [Anaerolineales bacterium]|nr:hypothetical protein [Anaerolineales bacterium]
MTRSKIFLIITFILLAQISCFAPRQEYSDTTPIPVEIQIPAIVKREQELTITLTTEPSVTCLIVVSFWNSSNDWTGKDLPTIESDESGICEWRWEIPKEAKDGVGEIRGFVKKGEKRTDFIPKTFCVETCP